MLNRAAGAVGAINMERLNMVGRIIDRTVEFIDNVYIPDLLAIASFYKHWGAIGGGISGMNVMAYGEFPDIANDQSNKSLMMPRGAILGGDLKNIHAVDLKDPTQIQEFVAHSWYKYADESKGLHPWDGVTEANWRDGVKTVSDATNHCYGLAFVVLAYAHALQAGVDVGYGKGVPVADVKHTRGIGVHRQRVPLRPGILVIDPIEAGLRSAPQAEACGEAIVHRSRDGESAVGEHVAAAHAHDTRLRIAVEEQVPSKRLLVDAALGEQGEVRSSRAELADCLTAFGGDREGDGRNRRNSDTGRDFAEEQGSLPCAWPVTPDMVNPGHPSIAVPSTSRSNWPASKSNGAIMVVS